MGWTGKIHQDPDRDRYTSDEEGTVVDNAADELETDSSFKTPNQIAATWYGRPYHLEPSVQEATPLKRYGVSS